MLIDITPQTILSLTIHLACYTTKRAAPQCLRKVVIYIVCYFSQYMRSWKARLVDRPLPSRGCFIPSADLMIQARVRRPSAAGQVRPHQHTWTFPKFVIYTRLECAFAVRYAWQGHTLSSSRPRAHVTWVFSTNQVRCLVGGIIKFRPPPGRKASNEATGVVGLEHSYISTWWPSVNLSAHKERSDTTGRRRAVSNHGDMLWIRLLFVRR